MSRRQVAALLISVGTLTLPSTVLAQKITVKAAGPPSATQGTTSLNVKITGSGFAPGAKAEFLKSGTVDPDGIKVNTTSYISNTELTANIDIADTAALALFDIKVSVAGRSGKGTDLFRVDPHEEVCTIPQSDPGHFQYVGALNSVVGGAPRYAQYLGASLAAGVAEVPLPDASTREVLVVFSGMLGSPGVAEIFFVDPVSGALLDGTTLGGGAAIQPHLTVALPYTSTQFTPYVHRMVTADLNLDGVPDAVASDNGDVMVAGLVSHLNANGTVGFAAVPFPVPSGATIGFGMSIAIGDTDGVPGLEVVVIEKGTFSRKTSVFPRAHVYRLAPGGMAFELLYSASLTVQSDDNFGNSIALGDVTGDGRPDLVGAAPIRTVGRTTEAGAVLVFSGSGALPPYRFSSTAFALVAAAPVKNERIGETVFVGNSDSDAAGQLDVIALGEPYALIGTVPVSRGLVFRGPLSAGSTERISDAFGPPSVALAKGWGTAWRGTPVADVDHNGLNDIIVPASGADITSACNGRGAVHVFLAQSDAQGRLGGWQRSPLYQPADDPSNGGFGGALAWVPESSLLIVGDPNRTLGGVGAAGQIFVYRVY